MRLLVTGATGFIGRTLVPRLLESHDVSLLVAERYGSGAPLPSPLIDLRSQINLVYADLRNYQLTARAVARSTPEVVIHLAAAGVSDPFLSPATAVRHNVNGTLNLIRAAFESYGQVDQFIVARTPGELTSMNVYAASKAAAWQFCAMYARTAAWPIHGAMIYQAYGAGQIETAFVPAAVRAALAGDDFPMTSGTQQKDWIHISDVVQGLQAMVGSDLPPGETLGLGTGVATSLREVVEMVYALVGRGGRPFPGVLPSRPGEEPLQVATASQTYDAIGFRSQITLQAGLGQIMSEIGSGESRGT